MLVRNLTKVSLPLRKHGQKILLLPGKATEVPDTLFSKEQVKNIYGSFVQILNEELVRDEEPVIQQTIEIKIEDNKTAEAVKEVLTAPKKEEPKEEAPAEVVEEKQPEAKPENAIVIEEIDENGEIKADGEIEEISVGAIADLAEEIIEDVKAEVKEEKPAKKPAKKTAAKKATKKK